MRKRPLAPCFCDSRGPLEAITFSRKPDSRAAEGCNQAHTHNWVSRLLGMVATL